MALAGEGISVKPRGVLKPRYRTVHPAPKGGIQSIDADAVKAELVLKHPKMDVVAAPTSSFSTDDEEWERYNFARFYTPAKKKYHGYDEMERVGKSGEVERSQFRGVDFEKTLPTYSWNQDVLGYPSLICTCYTTEEVVAVVNFARDHCKPDGIDLAVASGRHSITTMPDNSIVLDLSGMKDCVMGESNVLSVQGGAQLHDVDLACNKAGTCMPLGGCPTTGMGLLLMGGYGHLSRKYGLALDQILEVTLVTAAGEVLVCNATKNQELLWANKGGAGNFGVVVEMKVQTHLMSFYKDMPGGTDSGTQVLFQQRVVAPAGKWGLISRGDILRSIHLQQCNEDDKYFSATGDSKVGIAHAIVVAGGPVITWQSWTGESLEEGKRFFNEGRRRLRPALVLESKMKLVDYHKDVQWSYFPFSKAGSSYLSEVWFEAVSPELLETLADCFTWAVMKQQPFAKDLNWKRGEECVCHTQYVGGRVSTEWDRKASRGELGNDAFCLRKYRYWFLFIGVLDHTLPLDEYEVQKKATQAYFRWIKAQLQPYRQSCGAAEDSYTGHQMTREGLKVRKKDAVNLFQMPAKLEKLRGLKVAYDPGNLFCLNWNLQP